jgi:hypothetical protein
MGRESGCSPTTSTAGLDGRCRFAELLEDESDHLLQPAYLNGHSYIEQELNRGMAFRENDNAFLAVDDIAAPPAAADKLSPAIIRERLDYWNLILGPKFSNKERKKINLSRFYSISQIEYCRNFIFKRNFPIHKLFERSCELGLWRLTAHKISEILVLAYTADWAANSPPSSISTGIMSIAPTSNTRS